MSAVTEGEIIRENLRKLTSREVREMAMSESVGGNAGPGCYVLNLEVDEEGRILYAGNDPERTNIAIRVFTSAFFPGSERLGEMVLDVHEGPGESARRRVGLSSLVWNIHRKKKETEILDRFLDKDLEWTELVELLRGKYPKLPRDLG